TPGTINELWRLMVASYKILNNTHPNLTKHCWLCYNNRPPFYEAIGVTEKARRINGSNPAQCSWKAGKESTPGITIAQVSGKGKCIG
ncbi:ENV2 protein, partial [Malurus elegans]|nr:ENV2 protein [Malurus elegans]